MTRRRPTEITSLVGIVLTLAIAVVSNAVGSGRGGAAVRPDAAIGPVHLGEPRAGVEQRLGRGQPIQGQPRSGSAGYRSGTITLQVSYGRNGRVEGIETNSSKATLYGRPLSESYRAFRDRLDSKHGWTHFRCQEFRIFTHHIRQSTTAISWYGNKLSVVDVSTTAPPKRCSLGSPARPPGPESIHG